ncbi:hypothetical protein MAMC_01674 [Methylacidimicrobium cyclopophantes]|uniref:Uncharacterized protein n=1 Tax=Methylacidimicrobium cyclopophantes TaxID=1041766 RepID=A0A5E6ME89_9BACT|nr:hypothetical protein MAMC_01674 [Methylacidimicrobium cyclopophantes]
MASHRLVSEQQAGSGWRHWQAAGRHGGCQTREIASQRRKTRLCILSFGAFPGCGRTSPQNLRGSQRSRRPYPKLKSYRTIRRVYIIIPGCRGAESTALCGSASWPFRSRARLGTGGSRRASPKKHPKRSAAFQGSLLVQLAGNGQPWIGLFSRIPRELNALFPKLDLLPRFAHPSKWAL